MIIDKTVKIKIGKGIPYKWYLDKGYGPFKNGDIINVKIEDLTLSSAIRISVKCDFCENINNIRYENYNHQIKKSATSIYSCGECRHKKSAITNMERYGVDYLMKSKDMREKSKTTCLENYGVENVSQNKNIKDKKKETCFKNWGVNCGLQNIEKSKTTLLEKYGFENVSQNEDIKKKKKETCFKNWGVENPSQSIELFEKSQKSGKKIKLHNDSELWYRGTYELDFLNFCYLNNIVVQKGFTISYIMNEKNKYYHSDFYLPKYNLICEIKSNYYYDKFLETNLLKEKYTKEKGYNFIFIINKKYDELRKIVF